MNHSSSVQIAKLIQDDQPLRMEKKFWIMPGKVNKIRQLFESTGLHESYPKRQVNSVYFDTPDLEAYQQSLSGDYYRWKIRQRWYGNRNDNQSKAHLEIKYKRGNVGGKQIYPIDTKNPYSLHNTHVLDELRTQLIPTLATHYLRHYMLHQSAKVRVTIDTQLENYCLLPGLKTNIPTTQQHLSPTIIEVKFLPTPENETIAGQIVSLIPTSPSRFSKYTWGLGE